MFLLTDSSADHHRVFAVDEMGSRLRPRTPLTRSWPSRCTEGWICLVVLFLAVPMAKAAVEYPDLQVSRCAEQPARDDSLDCLLTSFFHRPSCTGDDFAGNFLTTLPLDCPTSMTTSPTTRRNIAPTLTVLSTIFDAMNLIFFHLLGLWLHQVISAALSN